MRLLTHVGGVNCLDKTSNEHIKNETLFYRIRGQKIREDTNGLVTFGERKTAEINSTVKVQGERGHINYKQLELGNVNRLNP
jgi:hypothetical protein